MPSTVIIADTKEMYNYQIPQYQGYFRNQISAMICSNKNNTKSLLSLLGTLTQPPDPLPPTPGHYSLPNHHQLLNSQLSDLISSEPSTCQPNPLPTIKAGHPSLPPFSAKFHSSFTTGTAPFKPAPPKFSKNSCLLSSLSFIWQQPV